MNHSQKKDKLSRYVAKSQWNDWQVDVLVPCYMRKDANGIWQALIADTGGTVLVLHTTAGYRQSAAVPSTGYMPKREQQLIAALTTYLENQ